MTKTLLPHIPSYKKPQGLCFDFAPESLLVKGLCHHEWANVLFWSLRPCRENGHVAEMADSPDCLPVPSHLKG